MHKSLRGRWARGISGNGGRSGEEGYTASLHRYKEIVFVCAFSSCSWQRSMW